jgi:hypothetical protein
MVKGCHSVGRDFTSMLTDLGLGFVLHSPTSNAPSLINSDQVPELIDEQKVGSSIDSHDIICVYR